MRGELTPLTSFQQLQSLAHWEPWLLMSHEAGGWRWRGPRRSLRTGPLLCLRFRRLQWGCCEEGRTEVKG